MRPIVVLLVLASAALTAPAASAATEVVVAATFTELEFTKHCALPDGYCGSGVVTPFGHATETIEFGAGCGGFCDLRTITLAAGTIVAEEVAYDERCPGSCGSQGRGQQAKVSLTDTVIGGTGAYADASGTLSGSVVVAGNHSQIKLAGTLAD